MSRKRAETLQEKIRSVGDSFGVWVLLAFTAGTFMFMAYKFWEGLLF